MQTIKNWLSWRGSQEKEDQEFPLLQKISLSELLIPEIIIEQNLRLESTSVISKIQVADTSQIEKIWALCFKETINDREQ